MSHREPCSMCPFRDQGGLPFCDEGHRMLNEGYEPSCHEIVGPARQFDDPSPSEAVVCKGFGRWKEGVIGFAVPKVI